MTTLDVEKVRLSLATAVVFLELTHSTDPAIEDTLQNLKRRQQQIYSEFNTVMP